MFLSTTRSKPSVRLQKTGELSTLPQHIKEVVGVIIQFSVELLFPYSPGSFRSAQYDHHRVSPFVLRTPYVKGRLSMVTVSISLNLLFQPPLYD